MSSSARQSVTPLVGLSPPSVVDLEADLEITPTFDEYIKDLPPYVPGELSMGKEKLPPSLLIDEEEAVAHLW